MAPPLVLPIGKTREREEENLRQLENLKKEVSHGGGGREAR